VQIVSREVVGISALLNFPVLIGWRIWKRWFVTRRVAHGIGTRNALIVGASEVGRELVQYLERNKQLGYRVVGFLDVLHNGDQRMLGRTEDLARIARAQFVDDIFVTVPSERDVVKSVVAEGRRLRLNVKVIPELYDGLAWNAAIHHLGNFPVVELHWEPIPTLGLLVKRLTDFIFSALALVILSPVLLLFAIAIRLDSRGPALYKSKRVGKKGMTFTCYKFRTMLLNAEQMKEDLRHLNERSNRLLFKITNDPRVTRIGKFLRRFSLDELPQLWNVLKGDMSLVGPRPPLPSEFDQYSLAHLRRLDVKPGMTGLWQVTARLDPSFENYMALDLKYIESWGFWMDAKILWKTIPVVIKGQGR
jgi:exopolysaccharide biosynthesis polyprenyl glycosylphosphotransferase